jgi:hypothetical protein
MKKLLNIAILIIFLKFSAIIGIALDAGITYAELRTSGLAHEVALCELNEFVGDLSGRVAYYVSYEYWQELNPQQAQQAYYQEYCYYG